MSQHYTHAHPDCPPKITSNTTRTKKIATKPVLTLWRYYVAMIVSTSMDSASLSVGNNAVVMNMLLSFLFATTMVVPVMLFHLTRFIVLPIIMIAVTHFSCRMVNMRACSLSLAFHDD